VEKFQGLHETKMPINNLYFFEWELWWFSSDWAIRSSSVCSECTALLKDERLNMEAKYRTDWKSRALFSLPLRQRWGDRQPSLRVYKGGKQGEHSSCTQSPQTLQLF